MECQTDAAIRRTYRGLKRCCDTGDAQPACGSQACAEVEPRCSNGTGDTRLPREDADGVASQGPGPVDGDAQAGRPNLDSGAGNGRIYYENGAKRDSIPERFDLIPMAALRECAVVMSGGAEKYGDNNWRGLPQREMLNHGMRHLVLYMSGDRSEPHLSHAACNLLMAMEVQDAR